MYETAPRVYEHHGSTEVDTVFSDLCIRNRVQSYKKYFKYIKMGKRSTKQDALVTFPIGADSLSAVQVIQGALLVKIVERRIDMEFLLQPLVHLFGLKVAVENVLRVLIDVDGSELGGALGVLAYLHEDGSLFVNLIERYFSQVGIGEAEEPSVALLVADMRPQPFAFGHISQIIGGILKVEDREKRSVRHKHKKKV